MASQIDSQLLIAPQQSTTPNRINTFAATRNDGTPVKRDNFFYVGDYTSKNRLKVSNYETSFFNTFQYGIETDIWDTGITGTASATWLEGLNTILLSVNGDINDRVVRQTKRVQSYVPGRATTVSFLLR